MFQLCFYSPFSSINNEKIKVKYCKKRIANRENDDVESHNQEESKLNSTTIVNSSARIIKNPFNKNNVATVKNK